MKEDMTFAQIFLQTPKPKRNRYRKCIYRKYQLSTKKVRYKKRKRSRKRKEGNRKRKLELNI